MAFIGTSGSGKTTLLRQLIPLLRAQGLAIGLIKTTHHDFEIDIPGKDSYELRKAGATQVLLASRHRMALIAEQSPAAAEPDLQYLLSRLDTTSLDLVLIEGMKHAAIPKIEVHRNGLSSTWLYPEINDVIALACDSQPPALPHPTILGLHDMASIANFIMEHLKHNP